MTAENRGFLTARGFSPGAVLLGAASSRAVARPVPTGGPPPSERMHELDFLLGSLRCLFRTGPIRTARVRPILGGHYYQLDLTHVRPRKKERVRGSWVLGWDRVDAAFVSYYFDDAGMQGTSTSPGWRDGHFVLTGSFVLGEPARRVAIRSDITRHDEDHFTIEEHIEKNGRWELLDTQDCARKR
ncbi:DUF1579 family protein [Streptomyces sp. G44]|uniref:DUF1579 family protein n=1 Tax=Streptomyces sp. G44 TaxID=2807632 RepID=UPI001960B2E4|nr:DUF1579 family protein [Streptomyces sp. G44]MBM7171047.1 DUF1579 family protein [Streptomyces sp. G44]